MNHLGTSGLSLLTCKLWNLHIEEDLQLDSDVVLWGGRCGALKGLWGERVRAHKMKRGRARELSGKGEEGSTVAVTNRATPTCRKHKAFLLACELVPCWTRI